MRTAYPALVLTAVAFLAGCAREEARPVEWSEDQKQQIALQDHRTTVAESAVDNDASRRGTGRTLPEDVIEP